MEHIIDRLQSRLDAAEKGISELKSYRINIQIAAQKSKEMEIMKGRLREEKDGTKRFKTNWSEFSKGHWGEQGRNIFQRDKDWEFSEINEMNPQI